MKKKVLKDMFSKLNVINEEIDNLFIKEAYVGKSLVMKRFRPRAKGRASGIKKPYTNITIILSEKKNIETGKTKPLEKSSADFIEKASGVEVPFTAGRGDASQEQTDVESFEYLEPRSDGFRNYHQTGIEINPEEMLLDKSQLLGLTAPEMTVLLGGMRSLGISHSDYGIISDNPN